MQQVAEQNDDTYVLEYMLPKLKNRVDEKYCSDLLTVTDEIYKRAHDYMNKSGLFTCFQTAIHCRRGDHKFLNCDAKVEEGVANAAQISQAWDEADEELQDLICKMKPNLSQNSMSSFLCWVNVFPGTTEKFFL